MFFLICNRKSVAPVSVVMIDEFIIVFSKGLHVSLWVPWLLFAVHSGKGWCSAVVSWPHAGSRQPGTSREAPVTVAPSLGALPTRQPERGTSRCISRPRQELKNIYICKINNISNLVFTKRLICGPKCGPWSCNNDAPAWILRSGRVRLTSAGWLSVHTFQRVHLCTFRAGICWLE